MAIMAAGNEAVSLNEAYQSDSLWRRMAKWRRRRSNINGGSINSRSGVMVINASRVSQLASAENVNM